MIFFESLETVLSPLPWWLFAVGFLSVVALGWIFAYAASSKGMLAALALQGVDGKYLFALGALSLCVYVLAWGLLASSLSAKQRRRIAWMRAKKEAKRTEYTLPDRENGYLRERLETVLSAPQSTETRPFDVATEYIKQTVAKLRAATLSAVDRMRLDEIVKAVAAYEMKGQLTGREQKELNVCLAEILKMAAKYGV